jgi:4-hydroxy-3-methylbut-2-en-1-yl diphosphate reductase
MKMGKLNLKVEIDKNSGFCFGVVSAINQAEKALEMHKKIYCLGEIVHNEQEIKRLESIGMQTITRNELQNLHNEVILFRAHGEPPSSYEMAIQNGNIIVDASCPIILKLQERIKKSYEQGENIYIFGKHHHPEIIGLTGQINEEVIVFENVEELNLAQMPEKFTLYSQTTRSLEEFQQVVNFFIKAGKDVKVKDTVCRNVSNRQEELIRFSNSFKKILFVAGKSSSNGKVLYNVVKKANPDCYFVGKTSDLKSEWFQADDTVGICGATSTPMWLMVNIKEYLVEL